MASVSAVVMTLNEERNIEYCLRSVRSWCDEVIVVDMVSQDRTREIAGRYADEVLEHERIQGFDAGRTKGFERATGDWILSIDADEVITPELAEWIRSFVEEDPPFELARIPRVNIFLGRWIRHTPWWPGKPRLCRRGSMIVSDQLHHGLTPPEGSRTKHLPRDPKLSMWHFSYRSLDELTEKMNRYTTIEARQAIERGARPPRARNLLTAPVVNLWRKYIRRRAYRDGMAGLTYAINFAYYRYLTVAKRWDEQHASGRQATYDEMREQIVSGFPDGGRRSTGEPTDPPDVTATARSSNKPAEPVATG